MTRNTKGFTGIEIALAVALLGGLAYLFAPKFMPGASLRADKSVKATEQLEQATTAQGSSAAASIAMIGTAAGMAEASPAVDFIRREVPVALAKLPTPDPLALIQAEQRRVAVMEGKLDEARRLYEKESKRAAELQRERDEALAARRQADAALVEAAAAERARTMQMLGIGAVALVLGALWVWAKLNGVSLHRLAEIRASVANGEETLPQAINRLTSVRQQAIIRSQVASKVEFAADAPTK